jgi:hypothetical protein
MKLHLRLAAILSCLVIAPIDGRAEESHGEHSGGHEFHQNMLAAFVGVSSEDRGDTAFTLGLEYERLLSPSFGLGLVAERAFGDLDFWIYVAPFAFHSGQWKFYAGPGVEDSDEHGSEFLFRLGVEYAFEVGDFEIAPQLDVDFVNGEEVLVLGLVIGKGF